MEPKENTGLQINKQTIRRGGDDQGGILYIHVTLIPLYLCCRGFLLRGIDTGLLITLAAKNRACGVCMFCDEYECNEFRCRDFPASVIPMLLVKHGHHQTI